MVRSCPPTTAPRSAFASDATSAGKTPNIFLESSSQIAETITVKAAAPGTEAFEASIQPVSDHFETGCMFFDGDREQRRTGLGCFPRLQSPTRSGGIVVTPEPPSEATG